MQTLLDKVQKIEEEIEDRISTSKSHYAEQFNDLLNAEASVIEEVRRQAEKRGRDIIAEQVKRAEEEINAMKQDEARSVKSIHTVAQERRAEAVEKALALFKKTYTP